MKLNSYLIYLVLMGLFVWKIGQTATLQVKQAHAKRAAAIERALGSLE